MNKQKVVIGLSGGVDSSVAAALLLKAGYDVEAVYLECYNEPGCRTDQDKKDALQVALRLGIRFQTLDFRKAYREKVIEYFYQEYAAGRTPNPDVVCNREIKFGIFYDWAIAQGYDYVATGHYARIAKTKDGSLFLQQAKDKSKDQSYFLWQIPRDHLSHIIFPLGDMLKSEVRQQAHELGLVTAEKPDSMGICFIGEVDISALLRERLGENPGAVVLSSDHSPKSAQGSELTPIGTHRGLWFHTIGERSGLVIDKVKLKQMGMHPEQMPPLYVIGKDREKNQLIVGSREETMRSDMRISNIEYRISEKQMERLVVARQLFVRIRNLGELTEVVSFDGQTVKTKTPLFGIAEGQSAVFYDVHGVLVGGGIIV